MRSHFFGHFITCAFVAASMVMTNPAWSETEVLIKTPMSFENCLLTIDKASLDLGVAPQLIVSTAILEIVRFPTNNGSEDWHCAIVYSTARNHC